MDFPIQDLMNEDACYQFLLDLFHPAGLRCPRCHAAEGFYTHRYFREPVLDYRCPRCGRVFNTFTGTSLQGTHRRPAQLLLILRGIAQGTPTAPMARELGCDRKELLSGRPQISCLVLG